jgi:hypothetical protein
MKMISRILLIFSGLLFALGAWVHTSAFGRVSAAVAKSDLADFFGKGFKTLWLMDSALQIILAILFLFVAIRPSIASRWVIVLVALIPLTTAMFAYYFLGNFIAGHLFLVASLAAIFGALLLPANGAQRR